jgi:hypothetical protein
MTGVALAALMPATLAASPTAEAEREPLPATDVAGLIGADLPDEGLTVEFSPGDGPTLGHAFPEELREFVPEGLDEHRVGDRWQLTYKWQSPTGNEPQVQSESGCADDKHCDHFWVFLSVDSGFGYYDTSARSTVASNRRVSSLGEMAVAHNLEARHHHDGGDISVTYGGRDTCFTDYCQWMSESMTLNSPHRIWYAQFSIPPSLDLNHFDNDVVSSAKARVTDSWGTDNRFCTWALADMPFGNTSTGQCPYSQPLP